MLLYIGYWQCGTVCVLGSVAVHCLPVDLFCTAVCEYRTNALMWLLGHFAVHGHCTGAQSHTAADLGVCDVIGNNH